MKKCFRIHESDNVATLVDEGVEAGEDLELVGSLMGDVIRCVEPIALGHKIALSEIADGEPIVKYGVVIGIADQNILRGTWVHLHNCRSRLDHRSGTLDPHTGFSQDVTYE
jgi:altronate dehydratase small subunit